MRIDKDWTGPALEVKTHCDLDLDRSVEPPPPQPADRTAPFGDGPIRSRERIRVDIAESEFVDYVEGRR